MDLHGRTAIVTGASGGIGSEVVRLFIEGGANVLCIDRRTSSLFEGNSQAICMSADICDEESVSAAVSFAAGRLGHIDFLVNAAGASGPCARPEDYPFDELRTIFEVNVFGTFLMMKYTLPFMQKQGHGAIVNFGSVSGMEGYPYEIGYGASKWAVIGMTKNAANENGCNGVRINSVSPGWVDTDMMKRTVESYRSVVKKECTENVTLGPMKRPAEPVEIAKTVLFLCSDEASYINGANIVADGGMTLG